MEKFKHNKTLFAAVLLLLLATSVYAVSPKVVKTVPQNGDENIRPGLRRIKILFDQDMDRQGHSVCGGGPTFPEIVGKPRWTDKRTFTMSAKLKPFTEYELYVNSPTHKNFKNLQGEPAVVYHLKFKTAPVKGKAPGPGKSPAILLQKARYAEETEGDLDKAIELYQQTIDRAGQVQRIAAQATYQLGMCYLKKGEKKKAAEYFGLVSNYPTQKAIVEKAKQQLKELKPEKVDSVFEQMSYQTLMFIADKYGKLAAEAGTKSLFCNAHIYCVDPDLAVYSGGLGYHYNWTAHSLTGKVKLSGTSYPNQTLYDTNGQKLNTEIVEDEKTKGFYHIYWTPDDPLKPQEALYYGWSKNDKRKLSPLPGSGKGILTMQNQYGPKVLETFFLVLPPELAIAQDAAPTDSRDFGDYKVFWWTKEVPQNANHVENVMIQKAGKITDPNAVSDVVSNVILTISTCAESDPRVGQSLKKLKSVDDKAALAEIGKYLDSEKPTVRRSAIFVCWRGEFDNIGPVEEKLMKLCSHKESFTRGMSAITLGAGKVNSSFETLTDMTLHDNDGYARRCAAYALGLYGDKKAIGVLEKALEDKDPMVKSNAEAALRMLKAKPPIDLSTPEATIKSFVKAVYDGNLEAAKACVSKDGHDYDEFKEMLATESNHPFQAMIKAMDASIPVEITSKDIKEDRCKIKWYFTLGRVYYFGETKMKKGMHQKFGSYLELVGDKWLIRDI